MTPDYKSAYVWLSIAQAYGLEEVTELLDNATKQLTLEEVLQQQDESAALLVRSSASFFYWRYIRNKI